MNTKFDHIETHVKDIKRYCDFLVSIFEGGHYEQISDSGTSMYTSPEGINIEVKKTKFSQSPIAVGFCNPCLRRQNAGNFILELGFAIDKELQTPEGPVYFFTDHEGIIWHMKDRNG